MIREVQDGVVDASITGFATSEERFEAADFSQGLFRAVQSIIIKRPKKTDVSFRYFLLGKTYLSLIFQNHLTLIRTLFCETEFTSVSWLMILIAQAIILFVLTGIIYILTRATAKNIRAMIAIRDAINITYRGIINKGTNQTCKKSQAFKILIFSLMVLGFILLCYYKAQMNAALNVEVDNMPIKSWEDVYNSHYKLLVWFGTVTAQRLSNAPKGSLLHNIYLEKVQTVSEDYYLNNIGFTKSVPLILSGEYLVFDELMPYLLSEDYPCGITEIKEFR